MFHIIVNDCEAYLDLSPDGAGRFVFSTCSFDGEGACKCVWPPCPDTLIAALHLELVPRSEMRAVLNDAQLAIAAAELRKFFDENQAVIDADWIEIWQEYGLLPKSAQ